MGEKWTDSHSGLRLDSKPCMQKSKNTTWDMEDLSELIIVWYSFSNSGHYIRERPEHSGFLKSSFQKQVLA